MGQILQRELYREDLNQGRKGIYPAGAGHE